MTMLAREAPPEYQQRDRCLPQVRTTTCSRPSISNRGHAHALGSTDGRDSKGPSAANWIAFTTWRTKVRGSLRSHPVVTRGAKRMERHAKAFLPSEYSVVDQRETLELRVVLMESGLIEPVGNSTERALPPRCGRSILNIQHVRSDGSGSRSSTIPPEPCATGR